MGIAISRLGDLSVGEPGKSPRPSVSGSGKCFAEGRAVHRLTDTWAPHTSPHTGPPQTTVSGSGKCFSDGLAVARIGDAISCGDTIATGSSKTFSI